MTGDVMTTMHTPGPLFPRKNSAGMWELYTGKYDYSPSTAFMTQTDDAGEANARLYAASPELLMLLIESQESIGGDWRARRDAAIARATGVKP
jgi:hypothetical protein